MDRKYTLRSLFHPDVQQLSQDMLALCSKNVRGTDQLEWAQQLLKAPKVSYVSWLWRARERKSTFGHLLMLPQTHLPKLYNGTPKCTYTKICRYFYIQKIFCFKKTIQKVGLEEIEKYQKGQKPYQNLYLDTNPEKVVKNSWSSEWILFTKIVYFWANKKVRSWRTFDKNEANAKSKAECF